MLALSIDGINVVVFLANYALTRTYLRRINIEVSRVRTGLASSETVQEFESRAQIRVVYACLASSFLRVGVILAVLTSSTLLENLPIGALVAGAASGSIIRVGVVLTEVTFTDNIEVLSVYA